MGQQEQIPVGKLIKQNAESYRDAIHVAIAPVTAGERLFPGQAIGFAEGDENRDSGVVVAMENTDYHLGIVDPFLKEPVYPEQRFFMFLFPHTVTGMRHHWEHPSFSTRDPEGESKRYLEKFCQRTGVHYDRMIAYVTAWAEQSCWPEDEGGELWFEMTRDDEFWKHFNKVTGLNGVRPNDAEFRCAC